MSDNSGVIETMTPKTGRKIKEDGEVVNITDLFTVDGSGNLVIRAVATT